MAQTLNNSGIYRWYKYSIICGFFPLITGITIFLTWYSNRQSWLETAGFFNIMIGIVLFLLGIIFLVIYIVKTHNFINSIFPLFILLINFPALGFILNQVSYIQSTYTVNIINKSGYTISQFYLSERDQQHPISNIQPNSISSKNFHFNFEGTVRYSLKIDGKTYEGIMFGYVSSGMRSSVTLNISEKGLLSIKEEF